MVKKVHAVAGRLEPEQEAELTRIKEAVAGRLWGKRLDHTYGVAETCRDLAARFGVDPFEAQAAGLLHDWDKKLDADQLWEKVERYGIGLQRDNRLLPPLHSWTAGASLPEEFPELPASVFQAVARHTVGAPDMTNLDMVVFCADMIEPHRNFSEVDALRKLARTGPLDHLFAACLQCSIMCVIQTGRYLYPGAVDVWNAYCHLLAKPRA